MIKVSVIIPAYNVEAYISKTLNSIINQTFKEFEIILVNDGSKDKTEEVSRKILSNSNVKFKIINQHNQGVSKARNRGIQNAKGKYIYFIDGDDYVEESLLEELYKKIEETNCDCVFCGYDHVDEKGYSKDNGKFTKYLSGITNGHETVRLMLKDKIWTCMNSIIFRKSLISENEINFDSNYKYSEDVLFTLRCLYNSKNVCSVKKELMHYLRRPGSATNTVTNDYFQLVYGTVSFDRYIEKDDKETFQALYEYRAALELLRVFSYLSRNNYDKKLLIETLKRDDMKKYLSDYKITEFSVNEIKQYIKIKLIKLYPVFLYRIYKMLG